MECSIVIQTCDKYEKFWEGLFYYMDKFWDKSIDCPIYFCTEEKTIKNKNFIQIKTGKKSFVNNLKTIIEKIETKNIFYMLEDFWPINNFKKDLFEDLYGHFENKKMKAFQISSFTPYYKLIPLNTTIRNQKLFKFADDSDWKFNLQTRFWDKNFLYNCLKEPKKSESEVSSAITVEIECSNELKSIKEDIFFYHYLWYPFSGVSYRGNFTNFGKELENNRKADVFSKNL